MRPRTTRRCRPQDLTLAILLHVAAGLEYLHGLGIVHGGAAPLEHWVAVGRASLAAGRRRCVGPHLSLSRLADLTPSNVLLKLDRSERIGVVAKLAVSAR